MTYKIVALCIIAVLIAMNYAVLVVASRAEERSERMYRKWREEHDE